MQRSSKVPMVAGAVVIICICSGLWWMHAGGKPKVSQRTATVRRGDVAATISATGTIEPVEVVDIGAQVAGLIKSFGTDEAGKTIDYGSIVEKDAVLATIDDSVYAANLGVAKAQVDQDKAAELNAAAVLEQSRAKLDQAEAEWRRAQNLFGSKLVAEVDYDTDKANYEIAKADVAAAEAGIAQAKATTVQAEAGVVAAQRNLDFCVITSPVRGVIIDRRVNIGQTVVSSLNTPSLFLIAADLTKMQIWVSVNEADVGRIAPGTPVTFTCDAFPGREFQASVGKVRLNATMSQNVVMYTVEVNTDNSDRTLLPYLTANVHFVVHKESNVLMVPNSALRWTPSTLAIVAPEARNQVAADPPEDAAPGKNSKDHPGVIWVKDGEYVTPVDVNVGTTDGANSAVTGNHLQEGQEVITGEVTDATPGGMRNPFQPPVIKR